MDKIILPTGSLPVLAVKRIEAAKPKEKPYRLLDGGGLYLYVPVSGKKVWQFRYKIDGKEKILIVGKYLLMILQEVRDKAWTAKKDISVGIDLVRAKKASSNNNSSSVIYKGWYEHKRQVWSVGYATELAKMFDGDTLPIIGGLEIQDIELMQLLEIIRRSEDRGAMERANKMRRRCGEAFRYVIVIGRAKYDPALDLADVMKGYRKKNLPFLPAGQIPAFNKALITFLGSIVSLIVTKVLCYTVLRTKELRLMLWKNVDSENRTITIDASVMEGRKIHVVPMLDQVIELPTTLSSITKPVSGFVSAGRNDKRKPVHKNAILFVIKQTGYEDLGSGHGFRHEFSTIMNEYGWPADAIGVQLVHANDGSVHGIYSHAQYPDKCGETMQWQVGWLDEKVEWATLTTIE